MTEIFENLRGVGIHVDDHELTLAKSIFEVFDVSRDGRETKTDLKRCADQEVLCAIEWDITS